MHRHLTGRLAIPLRAVLYLFLLVLLGSWGFGSLAHPHHDGPPSLILFCSLLFAGLLIWFPFLPQRIYQHTQSLGSIPAWLFAYCLSGSLILYAPLAYLAAASPIFGYLQPRLWWKLISFSALFFCCVILTLTVLFSLSWLFSYLLDDKHFPRRPLRTATLICLVWSVLIGGPTFILSHSYRFTVKREEDVFANRVLIITENVSSNVRAHLRRDLYQPEELQFILDSVLETCAGLEIILLDQHGACFMYASSDQAAWPPPEARHRVESTLHLSRRKGPKPPMNDHFRHPAWVPDDSFGWIPLPEGPHTIIITLDKRPLWNQISNLRLQFLFYGLVALLAAGAASLLILTRQRQRSLHTQLALAQERAAHHQRLAQLGAGLAHETKNPLGLIRGMAQSIHQAGSETPATRQYATQIIDEVDRIVGQLNQFLGFARPKSPHFEAVPLAVLFNTLLELIAGEAADKGIHLAADAHALTILADEQLLRRALLNLLLNALNACEAGDSIRLSARRENKRVRILVADTGAGIAPEDLAHVRDPYFTRSPDGAGLGLAIVDEIIANHGWRMEIESVQGEGATIILSGIIEAAADRKSTGD